jgi:hypothetical protein
LTACLLTAIQAHAQNGFPLLKGFLSPLTISGYAEAYYGGDFNNPAGNTRPRFSTASLKIMNLR